MSRVWFITGTSRGFGREFAVAALERGDRVAATARDLSTLEELTARFGNAVLPLRVDVTDRDEVFAAVATTRERFGRLDVVVNNAGYALVGAVEELSEVELRAEMETNFFGVLNVTQAALPILREQGSGHFFQISSVAGVIATGGLGAYNSSKWAMEALSDALSQEVKQYGIKVTIIEPYGFSTGFNDAAVFVENRNTAYDALHASLQEAGARSQPPGTGSVGAAILHLADAAEPPLRVFFGDGPTEYVPPMIQQRFDTWAEWAPLSRAAVGK